MVNQILSNSDISIYKVDHSGDNNGFRKYIVSTPETRYIVNDTEVFGIEYSELLEKVCSRIIGSFEEITGITLDESQTLIKNNIPSSLPFNMRGSIFNNYDWNCIQTEFITSKEDEIGNHAPLVVELNGILSNIQLLYADIINIPGYFENLMSDIIEKIISKKKEIKNIILIVFGSIELIDILKSFYDVCKNHFPGFDSIDVFFLEAIFPVNNIEGIYTPEFLSSKYELPTYPLERSILNDNGDRAYMPGNYLSSVIEYWKNIRDKAYEGISYEDLVKEKYPNIECSKFGKQNLMSLAEQHLVKLRRLSKCSPNSNLLK